LLLLSATLIGLLATFFFNKARFLGEGILGSLKLVL